MLSVTVSIKSLNCTSNGNRRVACHSRVYVKSCAVLCYTYSCDGKSPQLCFLYPNFSSSLYWFCLTEFQRL